MGDDLINDVSKRYDAYKKALEEAERDVEKCKEQMRPIQEAAVDASRRANDARASFALVQAEYNSVVRHQLYIARCVALSDVRGTDEEVIAAAHNMHFDELLYDKLEALGIEHTFVPLRYILEWGATRIFQKENACCISTRIELDPDTVKDVLKWPGVFSIDTELEDFNYLHFRDMS